MIVAGIGCRRGCSAEAIVALVRLAQVRGGCAVDTLAAPRFKQDEAGLHEAARVLGVGLALVGAEALQAMQPFCPTRSNAASRAVGMASVAEAAALAAVLAKSGGSLLLARIAGGGVTCALARV